MDRREFYRRCMGFAAGLVSGRWLSKTALADQPQPAPPTSMEMAAKLPDLVAVQNGEPDALFDAAIKAFGGMERVVKKGQTVVVKPNIGWDRPPEAGANTNPILVGRIVEHCYRAGAAKVYVLDHTCHEPEKCYRNSGIRQAALAAKAVVVFANDEKDYVEVDIPKAKILTKTKVHQLVKDCDVLINVPVLKHHGGAGLTLAMKNLMGVVWDRGFYHRSDLHQCIAEFCRYRLPNLNVIDAYRMTMANGPQRARPEDIQLRKSLILSQDIVAADAAAAKLFGTEPEKIAHIRIAHQIGLGTMELDKLNIQRITL